MNHRADFSTRKKVAIVGSGCTGIAALWALNRTYHDVYLYEAADRLGGHTNTVQWKVGKYSTAVDTGFIVLNSATYRKWPRPYPSFRFLRNTMFLGCSYLFNAPANFINFLKKLNVPLDPTEMTFGVSRDQGLFEWAGTNLGTIFCQKRNIFSLKMWRMIFDIIRFNQFALDVIINAEDEQPVKETDNVLYSVGRMETIGEYLDREGYSDAFCNDYLIPMTAAVWSTSPDKCSLEFPILTLVRFL